MKGFHLTEKHVLKKNWASGSTVGICGTLSWGFCHSPPQFCCSVIFTRAGQAMRTSDLLNTGGRLTLEWSIDLTQGLCQKWWWKNPGIIPNNLRRATLQLIWGFGMAQAQETERPARKLKWKSRDGDSDSGFHRCSLLHGGLEGCMHTPGHAYT